jgi:hypothetical protein
VVKADKMKGLPAIRLMTAMSYKQTSVFPCWKSNNKDMDYD